MSQETSSSNLTSLLAKITGFFDKTAPKLEQLEQSISAATSALEKAKTDLSEALNKVAALEKERDQAQADAKAAKDAMAKAEQELDKRVNILAGEKLSQVGAKPVKEQPADDPRQTGKANTLEEQFLVEADPRKRDALYAQIKEKWAKN